MRLLLCGGGTGGHIYPALAVVAELRHQGWPDHAFMWIGSSGQIEEILVPRAGIKLETIRAGGIAGLPWRQRAVNAVRLARGVGQATNLLGSFGPDVVLMTGGYINAPVALAAWLRRVPAAIYLPDIEPGMAIRWLSRFARRVACTAAPSARYFPAGKSVVTGYPVRREIREAAAVPKADALSAFELASDRPTVLVFGGSRGARSINQALLEQLPRLLAEAQIIHISGTLDWPEVEEQKALLPAAMRARYRAYPYLHERMGLAFRAADLAVARAGASMLGEAPAFGLPCVLVPYPHAWRYQKVNADYLAERGAAVRLDDHQLKVALAETVLGLLDEPGRLQQMSEAAGQLDTPAAAARLAELLTNLGRGKQR